jgi:tetratricopeptide (TPR) repeat protein
MQSECSLLDISAAFDKAKGQDWVTFPVHDQCSLSLEPFSTHIKDHTTAKPPRPWVLAVVDDGSRTWHYFDAGSLNEALAIKPMNPNNNEPVSKVHYIAIKRFHEGRFDSMFIATGNKGKVPKKVSAYITASSLDGGFKKLSEIKEAQAELADIYHKEGNKEETFYWRKLQFEMFPQDPESIGDYASCFFRGIGVPKDLEKAKELIERGLEIEPLAELYLLRAKIFKEEGNELLALADLEEAYESLDQLNKRNRNYVVVERAGVAWTFDRASSQERAEVLVKDLEGVLFDNDVAYYYLGFIYSLGWGNVAKDEKRAKVLLDTYITKQPQDGDGYWVLANLYVQQKRYKEAEENFKQALALLPEEADLLRDFGSMLVECRRFQEADTVLKKAFARSPGDQEIQTLLTTCKEGLESVRYRCETAFWNAVGAVRGLFSATE